MRAKLSLADNLEIDVFTGEDGALVIQIDTRFEPDYTPFRIHLNDATLHEGKEPEGDPDLNPPRWER
jgi:hypothetical protein